MENRALKTTPLLQEHKRLGARLAPFGGWLMPIQYDGIIAEHNWTRQSASIFDICHMGEFIVYGDCIKSNLESMLTFNLTDMDCASCHYGFMLNREGGIIDDLIAYRIEEEKWMLVVNAATTDNDYLHLKEHLSSDSKIENVSNKTAKIDLQGPLSKKMLEALLGPEISSLKYYSFGTFSLLGKESIISRTGYTGELGYELYINSEDAQELWKKLLCIEKIKPAGLGARDTLRLEMGYSLYGQDIDENTSPIEAGLEYFIDFDKEFIGRDSLLKEKRETAGKKLAAFKTDSRRSPRNNDKIYVDNKKVGVVTSGSFSPSLSCGIGMGYMEKSSIKLGLDILIRGERREIAAMITEKPFYKKATAKN